MTDTTSSLVSTAWLAERLGTPDLAILDASYFLPAQQRDARAEYLAAHLPGAGFFDIDQVADRSNDLPHMLPSPEQFGEAVGRLGIDNATRVIVYDSNYFMASARAWWMFRIFGHDRVAVLDGGIERWTAEHRPLTAAIEPAAPKSFRAGFRPELVRSLEQMMALTRRDDEQIVDARSAGRFLGTEPEPRAGIRGGHIPGSRNLPFRSLVDDHSRLLKSTEELAALFRSAGVEAAAPVVTTCGTGVTAAILALGLYQLGNPDVAVYDGSWTEWGGRADTPAALG